MKKTILIRNVPADVHRALTGRAAKVRLTLSDYLLSELRDLTRLPTPEEMRSRLEGRTRVLGGECSTDAVRAVTGVADHPTEPSKAPLMTMDSRLSRSRGHEAEVLVP